MKTLLALMACAALVCDAGVACAQDLSALPEYQPQTKISGVIRSWGSRNMSALMKSWEEGFHRYQHDIFFEDSLKGTASAQYGLHVNVADLALSDREIYPYEYYGIYRRSQLYPVEIAVATDGLANTLGIFVNKDNPLSKMTMEQLDGVYGDQRTGGWQTMVWIEQGVARGPEKNIRTWGQLGLTGEWADKPIHVYGPPGVYPGGVSFFQTRVMGGADTWNDSLREYNDPALMMEVLGNDPYGIAYTPMANKTAQVKALALSKSIEGPFVELTRSNVAAWTYPLAKSVYIYFAPDYPTGDPKKVDPKIEEFLRYVLSRQGQSTVEREGNYLPLTADLIREQLKKLK